VIGMSSTDICSIDPIEALDSISRHFEHWEIFSEDLHDVSYMVDVKDSLESYDLSLSVHSPISDTNIAAVNDRMRDATLREMGVTFECANSLGAEMVVVHPGVYSLSVPNIRMRSIEMAKRSLVEIEAMGREYGVRPVIENMPRFPIMMGQTPEEMRELLGSTDLGFCFDIGHANTAGCIDGFLNGFKRIDHIHIHDNFGDRDAHMTIGDGSIDFVDVISKLKGYRGKYIIESKGLESAISSKGMLLKILSTG